MKVSPALISAVTDSVLEDVRAWQSRSLGAYPSLYRLRTGRINMSSENSDSEKTIGPVRAWALAAGGMVGGGIYISLGVVIEAGGAWAWLGFIIAGLAALISAHSYGSLSNHFKMGGGAFDFIEQMKWCNIAGSLSWMLIIGYTLTISVYSYAFGHYVAHGFGGGEIMIRVLAVGIAGLLIGLNLLGAGKLTGVEVVIVSGNLIMLLVLAGVGMANWNPAALSEGIPDKSVSAALLGGAVIFISYEGFQLLTYEYDELKDPQNYFMPVLVSATLFVILCYVVVTLGATMISGAGAVVEFKDVALSKAAETAMGMPGLIAMTIAAGFATSAAINSTLFSTGKLTARVAQDGELPGWWCHTNSNGIPDRAVIALGVVAGGLAITGSLASLVEAASLVFVVTFGMVNYICQREGKGSGWIAWIGVVLCAGLGIVLLYRLGTEKPIPLAILSVMTLIAIFVRPHFVKRVGN